MKTTLCQECESHWSERMIAAVVYSEARHQWLRMLVCTNCLADMYERGAQLINGTALEALGQDEIVDVTAEARTEEVGPLGGRA